MVDSIGQLEQALTGVAQLMDQGNLDSKILEKFRADIAKATKNAERLPNIASTEHYSQRRSVEQAAKALLSAEKGLAEQSQIVRDAAKEPGASMQDLDAGAVNPVIEALVKDRMAADLQHCMNKMPQEITDKLASLKEQERAR